MRILFVNQFIPPDTAPTSRLIAEFGDHLASQGWEVRYIGASKQAYQAGPLRGWKRLLRDMLANARILWRGLWSPRCDWVFCLSDPPGLVFTSALLARLKRARLAHWAMDVYPEIAAALGALSATNPAYGVIRRFCQAGYAHCGVIGVLDEDMAEVLGVSHDPRMLVCPPWPPPKIAWPQTPVSPSAERIRWLYSGNLGRAHDYETLLRAQKILEDHGAPFDLVFQGGGAFRIPAQQLQEELGLVHCEWLPYADDNELIASLLKAHVLIATQRSETRGLLWPSKLALMTQLPRAVVWVGHPEGAISRELRQRQQPTAVVASGESEKLAQWLLANQSSIREAGRGQPSKEQFLSAQSARRTSYLQAWTEKLRSAACS